VILHSILATLALLSLTLTLWQWLAARRFPLHQRNADLRIGANRSGTQSNAPNRSSALPPAVTLLKPLKGCDEHTEACLRSWLVQDYAGEIQTLFAVGDVDDPACAVVKTAGAMRNSIVCPERLGANAKVAKLAQLEPHAKHEISSSATQTCACLRSGGERRRAVRKGPSVWSVASQSRIRRLSRCGARPSL
jgi:ceramide glucosyltransferase